MGRNGCAIKDTWA